MSKKIAIFVGFLSLVALGGANVFKHELRLLDSSGKKYMGIAAPTAVTTSKTLKLPDGDGTANQTLCTDGFTNLQWCSGPASQPANYVLFSDGSTPGGTGDIRLEWNPSSHVFTVVGAINLQHAVSFNLDSVATTSFPLYAFQTKIPYATGIGTPLTDSGIIDGDRVHGSPNMVVIRNSQTSGSKDMGVVTAPLPTVSPYNPEKMIHGGGMVPTSTSCGSSANGAGYSCAYTSGTGDLVVTFSTAFGDVPSCMANTISVFSLPDVVAISSSSVTFRFANSGGAAITGTWSGGTGWNFLCVGMRGSTE